MPRIAPIWDYHIRTRKILPGYNFSSNKHTGQCHFFSEILLACIIFPRKCYQGIPLFSTQVK